MTILYIIVIAVIIGLIPAYIAYRRGFSFIKWWIYGTLLFLIALPHSMVVKQDHEVKCPFCGGITKVGKGYCRRCGYEFM